MSDKQMYDILGKFKNLEPKLTKVTDKDINQSVQETVDPASLKGHIQQLEEKYMGFKKTVAAVKKGGSAEDPEAVAAAIGRKKYGKEKFQKAAAAGKKLGEDSVFEGKMKDLSMDLRELSMAEFKKKYGMTKEAMRKSLNSDKKDDTKKVSEGRELKNKDEFDRLAKVGDYYHTAKGGKVTKTASGIKHEEGHKKQKDDDLDESLIQEKAKSKAQQKFMGMVYAAKKGEKAASPAVAKVAKGMSKSDAKDFAKTKHKGLPQHVKESHDIRKHPIYTTQEAWDHYSRELAEQEMSAMETDMTMEEPLMDADHELDEIARLAGLHEGPAADAHVRGDNPSVAHFADQLNKLDEKHYDESACNMTAEGEMCPEHGLQECGMYSEGNEFSGALAKARAAGAKEFEVDGKEYPVHEAEEAMDEGNEFTKARLDAIKAGKDTFTVGGKTHKVTGDTSTEKQQVEESVSVNISATDEDVIALMQKLAGLPTVAVATNPAASSCGCSDALEEERDIEWDNTPNEQVAPLSAAIPNGTDLHKSKVQDPQTANKAANPLAETEEKLWKSYERMLKAIKD